MPASDDSTAIVAELHPNFPGEATVWEMIREFGRFGRDRRLLVALQIILSLAGFVLTALIPLRIGDLLGTALTSANTRAEVARFVNDANADERAVADELLPQLGSTAERNAAVAAIRATQYQVRVSTSGELLDTLFPKGFGYSSRGIKTIEDPESDWEMRVSGVLRNDRIKRADLEALVADPTENDRVARNRAFTYLVNLLLVDDSAVQQRNDFQRSLFIGELVWFAVIIVSVVALRTLTLLLAARTTYSIARRLQDAAFARIHDTALVDGGALPRPSMVSRCTSYVERVTETLVDAQTEGIPDLAALILSTALLLYIDIPIGLLMVGVIVLFELARRTVAPHWSRLARERLDLNTAMSEVADEAITRAASVRAMRSERAARRGFGRWADVAALKARRLAGVGEGVEVSAFGIGQLSVLVTIAIVGFVRKDLSLAEATAVILYVREVSTALEGVPTMVVKLQEAAPYMRRLRRVFAAPLRRTEPAAPVPFPARPRRLRFDAATFVHADGAPGCSPTTLDADTSRWTVLCGIAGSGVPVLLDLASGIEVPEPGSVLVDDVPLGSMSSEDLRFGVVVLPEHPEVIEGTVRENIEWSLRREHSDTVEPCTESVMRAAERAGLGPWLATLPLGLDTPLGQRRERTESQNGPARKRIDRETCIRIHVARVLASEAPVVVLHDIGRLLDREVGEQIWGMLRTELTGRIVVASTERLDLVGETDAIHCLRGGTVVESGSRQQLLERNSYFASLWSRLVEGGSTADELAAIPALSGLSPTTLDNLVPRLVTERFDAGSTVFQTGDPADRVFIVVDGTVDLLDGERRLASVHAGFHFGDFDLGGHAVRPTTAVARTPVVLRSLHRLAISGGLVGVLDRPREERAIVAWLMRHGSSTREELMGAIPGTNADGSPIDIERALGHLLADGTVTASAETDSPTRYRATAALRRRAVRTDLLDGLLDD